VFDVYRKDEREMKPGCRENHLRVSSPLNQASPHRVGASWSELIPMYSGLAQTTPTIAEMALI
jgi:hypothetical protein